MPDPSPGSRWERRLDRFAGIAVLLLPLLLVHGRAPAEATLDLVALSFLLHAALAGDWAWLRRFWVRAAIAWWGWLLLCSLLAGWRGGGWNGAMQAALLLRAPVFVAALEHWALRPATRRRRVVALARLAALYIVAQEALQLTAGHNLFGHPRRASGELTGPYQQPRAGPVLSRLLPPALLPPASAAWSRGMGGRLVASALVLGGVAAMVLFGQRMPLLLTGLGFAVSALLLPRLRPALLAALGGGIALAAASALFAPPTFERLVTRFAAQMADWPDSPYGQLAARAVSIAQAHPVFGVGFDGFRAACPDRVYWHGWPQLLRGEHGFHDTYPPPMRDMPAVWRWLRALGGGVSICAQHPHNHYLQALEESGLPGLALFCLMAGAWLRALGRELWRRPEPLRVGLFAAALIQEWPIASSSDFVNMPLGGWFLLLLGLGLAEARRNAEETRPDVGGMPD